MLYNYTLIIHRIYYDISYLINKIVWNMFLKYSLSNLNCKIVYSWCTLISVVMFAMDHKFKKCMLINKIRF